MLVRYKIKEFRELLILKIKSNKVDDDINKYFLTKLPMVDKKREKENG